ncbi:MAG: class I SAM-dependent methyltransferase [Methanobrevibacter sp.]|jgi:cephalosporin hydroxylase|nr:class I SAM-dependent methyltransferase [Methanobrevibacter sp.]
MNSIRDIVSTIIYDIKNRLNTKKTRQKYKKSGKINPIADYFYNNNGKIIEKWDHYLDIYQSHFEKFYNEPIILMEFGVFNGGSLDMWKYYFGDDTKIIGIDINIECKKFNSKNCEIHIGDQENRDFLKKLMANVKKIDVVVEDGGHEMNQQINTFEEVFPYVNGGVFLIEDLHTSYWREYGGGYKKEGTFIEYAKNIIDSVNARHCDELKVNYYTKTIKSMSIYDSVIVFEKNDDNIIEKEINEEYYFKLSKKYLDKLNKPKKILIFNIDKEKLNTMRNYFKDEVMIFGVSHDMELKKLQNNETKIYIYNNEDEEFLNNLINKLGDVDVIIDNSFEVNEQVKNFKNFFQSVKEKGLYITNNSHSSYLKEYGGGYKKEGTFIEYIKDLIDQINAYHSKTEELKVDNYTKTIKAIHIQDSLTIFEKDKSEKKTVIVSGNYFKRYLDFNLNFR